MCSFEEFPTNYMDRFQLSSVVRGGRPSTESIAPPPPAHRHPYHLFQCCKQLYKKQKLEGLPWMYMPLQHITAQGKGTAGLFAFNHLALQPVNLMQIHCTFLVASCTLTLN